jgi:cephalosporin-C deacetylase
MRKGIFPCFPAWLALGLLAAAIGRGQPMQIAPDKAGGVYQVGESVRWTVTWTGEMPAPDSRYLVKSGGLTEVDRGALTFHDRIATLETTFEAPGTTLVEVTWPEGTDTRHACGGAVAAPECIRAAAAPPSDFASFWSAKLEELKAVPAHPKLEKTAGKKPGVEYWKITLDNIRGTHIQGQIARPEKGGRFPALLVVQWAGVYALHKEWVTDRAAEGWLALNIEPHDLPIDRPDSFYQEASDGPLKNYWNIGNDDRDQSYYLRMYLSCVQALEYLQARPDWDGRTLVVTGASQGGQQTLMLAGLHPKGITAALALVPAACDMVAPDEGRAPGFPRWYFNTDGKDPKKVREASRYYDPVNFARHIECPVLIALGLRDEISPPSSVLAAANAITAPKEVIILPASGHQNENGSQEAYNRRCHDAWLPALRQGKPAPVGENARGG